MPVSQCQGARPKVRFHFAPPLPHYPNQSRQSSCSSNSHPCLWRSTSMRTMLLACRRTCQAIPFALLVIASALAFLLAKVFTLRLDFFLALAQPSFSLLFNGVFLVFFGFFNNQRNIAVMPMYFNALKQPCRVKHFCRKFANAVVFQRFFLWHSRQKSNLE